MTEAHRKNRPTRRRFTAQEKCRAVLTLWTERRSMAELCRELGVKWGLLNLWQEQAMAGMLQALEPKQPVPGNLVPLNRRLQSLLERRIARTALPQLPAPRPENTAVPARRTVVTARPAESQAATPSGDTMAPKAPRTA